MKNKIKKIYSFLTYYVPIIPKIIESLYYHFGNIFYSRKDYNFKMNQGKKILESIISDKDNYYVIIDKGIGDTIIVASYAYMMTDKKICFVVPKRHTSICKLFNYIKDVTQITKEELDFLTFYINRTNKYQGENYLYAFFRMKVNKRGFRYWSSSKWDKKMILSERYKKYVFSLDESVEMYHIKNGINQNKEDVKKLEKKHGIEKNSILLAPYAYTEVNLDIKFWENLVEVLKEKGNYKIFTNIGNKELEHPIKGTEVFYAPLDDLSTLSKSFSNVIALRSGVCELLSLCNAKMMVISKNNKNYDKWDDVNNFSSEKKITNYYINNKDYDIIIKEIIDYIEGK